MVLCTLFQPQPSRSADNLFYLSGDISKIKPIIITEWGFSDENRYNTKQYYLVGDEKSYGSPFIDYLNECNIGRVACWFDDTRGPQMFKKIQNLIRILEILFGKG